MSDRPRDRFKSLLVGSRLALFRSKNGDGFYSGNGNRIEEHFLSENTGSRPSPKVITVCKHDKPTVHQLYCSDGVIFFAAERTFGLIDESDQKRRREFQLSDWLSAFRVFGRSESQNADATEPQFEIALLFASNVLRFVNVGLTSAGLSSLRDDIRLQPQCNLMSARFEQLTTNSWAIFVSTAFGAIHVYRILMHGIPTTVYSVNWREGCIFDMRLHRTANNRHKLYTVGDDRSLRVWEILDLDDCKNEPGTSKTDVTNYCNINSDCSTSLSKCSTSYDDCGELNDCPWRLLAAVYGHGARVFCVRLAPNYRNRVDHSNDYNGSYSGDVFTGGEDSAICVWKWSVIDASPSVRSLQLLKRIVLGPAVFGAIRAAIFVESGRTLVVSSETGALKSIALRPQTCRHLAIPEFSRRLLNFQFSDDQRILYFVDGRKTLYRCSLVNDKSVATDTITASRKEIFRSDLLKFELLEAFRQGAVAATTDSLIFIGKDVNCNTAKHFSLHTVPISLIRVASVNFDDEMTVVSLLDGTCLLFDVTASGLRQRARWRLKARAVVLSAAADSRNVILGTRNGHIIVVSMGENNTIVQIVAGAHAGKPVKAIYRRADKIVSLGRDGQLRYWTMVGDGHLSAASSVRCAMEIPCEAKFSNGKTLVCGFSAKEFVVYDAAERCVLARYNCAGGKRAWQIVNHSKISNEILFGFLAHGQMKMVKISLLTVMTITNIFSSSRVNCVRLLSADDNDDNYCNGRPEGKRAALAAGDDGAVAAFQLTADSSKFRPLFCGPTHTSSIFDIDHIRRPAGGYDGRPAIDFVVAVGGRAEISIFSLSAASGTPPGIRFLDRLFSSDDECDVRLVAVRLKFSDVELDQYGCLKIYVLGSDGWLRRLNFDLASNRLTVAHGVSIPNSLTMFWRLEIVGEKFYAISTCGRLFCYVEEMAESFASREEITVERCGLSALAVAYHSDDENLIFVGADSGTVSAWRHASRSQIFAAALPLTVHCSTVTDIKVVSENDHLSYRLFTVSTDCRVAFLRFDGTTLSLIGLTTLTIFDPASLMLCDPEGWVCLAVGDGVQSVRWSSGDNEDDEYYGD